ncbi:tRNA (adenosine(37)-N6)-threonylcarbamoyltransferase complex dimerization subunit type 1 TsaB [Botrimarina hoheduenensis]|uniref:N(6)-L-threonylcarbamoyladenine synthase n=1 Tax=Botrimarina hoheduenensis TaxID=2528000 RepID=A0A5C5WD59_9BACT|nr:tRNA (adenosine(37)-N6)-threonylcarbamoyltransferase complex dimerization subunit type 1 TsaB [Botrimarina hoheduenensis]TWT48427.1 tRNA threonylcarbamoyladenosine biosynthesis protein TsaB [Botrimarina hoheduenensis]
MSLKTRPHQIEPPTRLLAVETADRYGSVALAQITAQGALQLIGSAELRTDQRSAQSLAPAIGALLAEHGWSPHSLDVVAVASGPGSFTGLRVGVTTAKTLAYAAGATVVGVNTLAALAHSAETTGAVWGVLDAQRGEVFAVHFAAGESPAAGVATQRLTLPSFVSKLVKGDLVVSPLAANLAERDDWPSTSRAILAKPSAVAVAHLAAVEVAAGRSISPFELTIDYCRPSAAEEKAAQSDST